VADLKKEMKKLTMEERLAAIERTVTKSKCPSDVEQEIVWRLFGKISALAKSKNANQTEMNHAEWLMDGFEEILGSSINNHQN
jgi:hypothetical protein